MHILNVVSMNPDKRGPVELQLLETGRQATLRGDQFSCWFTYPAPQWYASLMADAQVGMGVLVGEWPAAVSAACDDVKPDLVHFHFGPHSGMSEAAARVPIVVRTEHSPRPRRRPRYLRSLVRHYRARAVDHFVAVSEFIAGQTMHDFLIPRSKITVIHNATDTARFRPQPENKQLIREELFGPMVQSTDVVIALAANLRPAKRQWMLVRALDELRGSHPDAKAVIAGDGPDREGIVELVADLEIGDRVIVLAGENDVAAIYAASDIAVLPSTGEGLPGSGIEALACGLPLVATPNGGTPEVFVEGENGISVRDQSPSGLARALVPLIESSSMRAKMGHSARRRAESYFAITRPANETLALYDRLRTL